MAMNKGRMTFNWNDPEVARLGELARGMFFTSGSDEVPSAPSGMINYVDGDLRNTLLNKGQFTPQQWAQLVNMMGNQQANAAVNPDGTVSLDNWTYDDEFDDGMIGMAAFGGALFAPAIAADAAAGGATGGGMDLGDWQNWGDLVSSNSGATEFGVGDWIGGEAGQIPTLVEGGAAGANLGGIIDTLKNLPTSALKSLGLTNPDGSLNMRTLGALLSTGLGAYGANQQADKIGELAKQYAEYGAPYRARLASSYADPAGFLANSPDIQASVNQGTSALARALSTKGNPTGSGSALQELQNYATQGLYGQLGNERNRLANFGGLSNFNAAAPGLAGQEITAQGGMLNALGSGISTITNPPTTLEQALNALGGNNFKLGSGITPP